MAARFLTRLTQAFAIDLEMLALFRLLLALIVIWGLLGRAELGPYLFPEMSPPESIDADVVAESNAAVDAEADRHDSWAVLYTSRQSRAVHTPWHWSVLWLDQVVQQSHTELMSVQAVEPARTAPNGPANTDPPADSTAQDIPEQDVGPTRTLDLLGPTTTPREDRPGSENSRKAALNGALPDELPGRRPVFYAWHEPLTRATDFLASRLWFDAVIGVGVAAGILLAVGLFTKTSNFILWVVVLSIQHRLPLFNAGGDSLERLFLFWLLFLPAGAVWSLDAWWFPRQGFWRKRLNQARAQRYQEHVAAGQGRVSGHSIGNWATAAILIQLVAIYFYSGLEKCNADWWQGTAIAQAWQWGFISKPLAATLAVYTGPLQVLTWGVLALELLCPLLVFCPGLFGWTRRGTAAALVLMHLGIMATMTIGTFSAVCIAGWLLVLGLPRSGGVGWRGWLRDPRDRGEWLPQWIPSSSRATATAAEWLVMGLLGLTVWWNLAQATPLRPLRVFPKPLEPLVCQLGLDPQFPMFGRVPQHDYGWRHRVELASGESRDIRPELPAPLNVPNRITTWSEPAAICLWRQLHVNLLYLDDVQPEFVGLVRERLKRLEFETWRRQMAQLSSADRSSGDKTSDDISADDLATAWSELVLVDMVSGDEQTWAVTDL